MNEDLGKTYGKGKKLPAKWKVRAKELMALPDFSRQHVLTIFAFSLNWFFFSEKKFTEENFISILEDAAASKNDKDAIWAGFFWGANVPRADLYDRLKPMLLQMTRSDFAMDSRFGEILSGILLSGWRAERQDDTSTFITNAEFRDALLNSNEEFRSNVLWQLERWSREENSDWPEKTVELLRNVWPKQKKARTPRVSARLFELAFEQKRLFPEISSLVADLVGEVENEHLFLPSIKDEEGANVRNHPKATLDLLFAILPEEVARWPYGAAAIVRDLKNPNLKVDTDPKLIELLHRLGDA